MEILIFQSPKKHRIIAIKKLLKENDISTTSVKLYICVEWNHYGRSGEERINEIMGKRDELNVDIEDFNEK